MKPSNGTRENAHNGDVAQGVSVRIRMHPLHPIVFARNARKSIVFARNARKAHRITTAKFVIRSTFRTTGLQGV